MPTTSLRIRYRPLRVAFLVRAGVLEDLVQVAAWASSIWGGVFSPILTLTDDEGALDRLIARWNVDVLAALPLGQTAAAGDEHSVALAREAVARHPHLAWPSDVDHLELFAPIGRSGELALLGIAPVAQHLWLEEYRHREESNWSLPRWRAEDPLAALFAVSFLAGEDCPLNLTAARLYRIGGRDEGDGVFLGDASSPEELRQFWNLRASGKRLSFLPEGDGQQRLLESGPHERSAGPQAGRRSPRRFRSRRRRRMSRGRAARRE